MFWVRIQLGGRKYLGVMDTGATISIVAKKILPCGGLKNTLTTAAIRMGDGRVVHSCGDCEVEVPMGSQTIAHRFYVMDTEAFDFVLWTDFFVQHSHIQSLTLQAPYLLLTPQRIAPRVNIFSFLEMNDLELVFLETYPRFPSNNPKMYPKSDHTRRRQHTQHSTKSRE